MNESDVYREWEPPEAWSHAVACCWEQRVSARRAQRVLPDGHADVLFHDSGAIEVVGLYDEVALPVLAAGTHLRGVRIRPAAVSAAFGVTASLLRNQSIAAEDLFGAREARRLKDPVVLDAWARSIEVSRRTVEALRLLARQPVEKAAAELGITSRQLQRVLLSEVGLAPKTYQRVVRLQRFVRATDEGATIASASANANYADQPHLTREVRRFSGLTPAQLILERRSP